MTPGIEIIDLLNLKIRSSMRKITLLLSMLLLSVLAFAQTARTGTVRDEKGEPIPFATITEVGKNNVVRADANGVFTIRTTDGAQLRVTASGHQDQTLTVSGTTVTATLTTRQDQLAEVVVTTALGVQRQAKELGYSTARVRAAELTQAAPVNLQNGLTGKVSGLNITTTSSDVLGTNRINLRGIRSITGNNQPMLILDGVPISISYLNSLNPNDIADVSILKSSTGTAIYGPDGVNGAIVITTKRGVKGRPTVTVSHTAQIERISYLPKFQKRYGSGYSPDAAGFGTFEPIEQQSWGDEFDGSIRQYGQTGPNGEKLEFPYSYNKNGIRNFWQTGVTNQTDVSYSTGDFYLSAQNVSIKGTVPDDVNNRRAFTIRADREYGKFRAAFNLRYTNSEYNVTNNKRAVYYNVTGTPGQYDLARFKDWRNDYFSSPNGYFTPYLDNQGKTPFFAKDNYREIGKTDDVFGNAEFNFKATDWLNFVYRVGISISNSDARTTRGAFTYSPFSATLRDHGTVNITSAVTDASNFNSRLTSESFANFNKKFSLFGLNATVGHSYRQTTGRFLSVGSGNLGTSELLSTAFRRGEPTIGETNTQARLERLFYRVGFDYDNWAFLETTGSYDTDSRLAQPTGLESKSDISYFYPGVSASLLLHQVVPALKESSTLSYLKLRGAWSKTGNVNLGAYGLQNTFTNSLFFPYGDILGFQANALTVAASYNPEFVINKEVGIELGFLRNRINLEGTYYHQDNTDQIIGVQLSNTTGYTTARQNAASFINKGLELDLRLTPLVRIGKVNVDFKVNYTNQSNKVTSLVDGVNELGVGNFNYAIVGQSIFKFKLTDYVRDDQGRVIVDKTTGMPTKNPNLTTFGNTLPQHLLGLNLNISWKGLTFSAVADHRSGNQIVVDELGGFLDDNGISERSAQNGRRAFVFPNSVYDDGSGKYVLNTDVYTQTYGRLFWNSDLNTGVTTNYLASGAFWKIREVAFNYEIPTRFFGSKLGSVIKGATIGINGRNLFMFLPKSNQWTDPEFSVDPNNIGRASTTSTASNAAGRSSAFNMPPTRIFGANLALRF